MKLLHHMGYSIAPPGLDIGDAEGIELMRMKQTLGRIEKGELEWPDVIKHHGGFCLNLPKYVEKYNWEIEHVFILVRNIEDAVGKRVGEKSRKADMSRKALMPVPSKEVYDKMSEAELREATANTIHILASSAIHNCEEYRYPYTVINYPRFVTDFWYSWEKIALKCPGPFGSHNRFKGIWEEVMEPNRVRNYK
jgi:hypothetical protein